MGNPAITLGSVVGRLAIVLGIEFISADVFPVIGLVFFNQFVVIGLNLVVLHGDSLGDMVHQAVDQRVAGFAFNKSVDEAVFFIAFELQRSDRIGTGSRLLVIGRCVCDAFHMAFDSLFPTFPGGLFPFGLFLVSKSVKTQLGSLLADQNVAHGVQQRILVDGFQHFRI